jgi:hypothetical protein
MKIRITTKLRNLPQLRTMNKTHIMKSTAPTTKATTGPITIMEAVEVDTGEVHNPVRLREHLVGAGVHVSSKQHLNND